MPSISGFAIPSMPSALSAIRVCDGAEREDIDLVARSMRGGETLKRHAAERRRYCGRNWRVAGGCASLLCVTLPHQRHGVFLREIPY